MEIVLHCLGLPFNGSTIYEGSLGGSETAGYYLARELAKRGHKVRVFTAMGPDGEGTFDGVRYLSAGQPSEETPFGSKFHSWCTKTPHDVLIVQRQPRAFHYQWASKINILQLHDLALFRQANEVGDALWNVSALTCVSDWHADQVSKVYPIPRENIDVVRNGVDLDLYDCPPNEDIAREDTAFKLLYQSRPERGLEHLVRPGGIMERLADTAALLYVCRYDCTVPQMRSVYEQLDAWCDRLPNVVMLGALSKPKLAAVQKACDLLVYPTEFEEVSCISVMEAMAAGLPVLASRHAALVETLHGCKGAHLVKMKLNGKGPEVDEEKFANIIRAYIDGQAIGTAGGEHQDPKMREWQRESAQSRTWAHAADQLMAVIDREMGKRSGNAAAVLKSAIEVADIDTAEAVIEAGVTGPNAIFERAAAEVRTMYNFRFTAESYAEHYLKHQSKYYDEHEEDVIGEDVSHTARFRATVSAMSKKLLAAKGAGLRILDYGCAHGHYLMPLAKNARKCEFTGVDISGRAIAAAMKWMVKDQLHNVTLVHGGEEALTRHMLCPYVHEQRVHPAVPEESEEWTEAIIKYDPETGKQLYDPDRYELFDIILAGEVVEHVWDYRGLIEKFRGLLKPDGLLVITTPYGRWEWIGHEAYKTGREHLHHFTRADLYELFAGHEVEVCCAAHGGDEAGLPIGSFVTSVTFTPDVPLGTIDAERHRREFSARQTVSACLIVKDGANHLRTALDSIAAHVDEVVIGIDKGTTDTTELVIEAFSLDNPWLPVRTLFIESPVVTGFDVARNTVHDEAAGQWILWMDADENVIDSQNLHKYLRPSLISAVHFPQQHYSAQPAQVLTTDHPCRLFRNDGRTRIYGVVHEHAESAPGEGAPQAIMRGDVQFAHSGYVTEAVRRKRYERNMPLLLKDVEKYPQRKLNQFLLIRDLAQGIVFDSQRHGGVVTAKNREDAERAIKVFRSMIDQDHPATSRLLIDALDYYSVCVEVLDTGFEAEVSFKLLNPPLKAASAVKGRFYNREHFTALTDRLFKEATKYYEQKYF